MTIADLIIKMSLDGKGVQRGADMAIGQFRKIGRAASNFIGGAFAVGTISTAMQKTVEYAGKINDLSQKLGVSTDALQAFDYAASQSGSSLDDVSTAITKLQQNMVQAMSKDGDKRDAFARMGVSLDDLKSKSPEQIFLQIAKSMNGVSVNAQRTADIMETLGKSATDLIPSFVNGFSQAADQAKELGQVMDESVVKELDNAGDEWAAAGKQLMVGLAPVITFLVARFNDLRAAIAYVSAALGSLSADVGQKGVLKTAADLLFPTKGSFGGNAYENASKAGEDAAAAIYKQAMDVADQRSKPATAIEVEEEIKKKKKKLPKIEQIGEISNHTIGSDAMQRIGLHVGPVSQLKQVGDKQLAELKAVRNHMQKIRELAEKDE